MDTTSTTLYPIAAIMIHDSKQEITLEKMSALFKEANVPFLPKLAEYYIRSKEQMDAYLSFIGSTPSQSVEQVKKEEVKEEVEEAAPEEVDIEFGDLFG